MARTQMKGPFNLNVSTIAKLELSNQIGNYALGFTRNGLFYIQRIGMAQHSLAEELESWVTEYNQFKYKIAESTQEAYLKVCTDYHKFTQNHELDNISHPKPPENLNLKCPMCRI